MKWRYYKIDLFGNPLLRKKRTVWYAYLQGEWTRVTNIFVDTLNEEAYEIPDKEAFLEIL